MDKKLVKPLLLKKVITINKLLQMHLIVLEKKIIGSTLAMWYVGIHNVNKGMYMYRKHKQFCGVSQQLTGRAMTQIENA